MKVIAIEPYWDNLQAYHQSNNPPDMDFWEWLRQEYHAYQVYIKSTPTALGEREACGLMFGEEDEAIMFMLRW
jgi:hypothetical protein